MPRFLPWLRLCRFPAVFTALADIVLGSVLTVGMLRDIVTIPMLVGLLFASAGLYMSGMVFNDLFDRKEDAVERPARPIPSGQVSVRGAAVFGCVLMGVGLGSAAWAGRGSLEVAIMLAACILCYDGGLKRTPLGPVMMGSCRFLNVLLGASGGMSSVMDVLRMPQLWVASGLGIYIVGVTWFARTEASVSKRNSLGAAMLVINFGFATLMAWVLRWPFGGDLTASLFVLFVIAMTINRRLMAALSDPQPKAVQLAVKTMLLSIITLDATLIYARAGQEALPYSAAVLLLLAPSLLLSRYIKVT